MRMIDADALIQKRNHAKNYSPDMYVIGQGYVMDAPTIDAMPVVHGEWIDTLYNHWYKHEFICSECGRTEIFHPDDVLKYPYCHCGARMDGGKKDE